MKLLAFASVTSFLSMVAFGMWQFEQSIIDEMNSEEVAVYNELNIIQCTEDRRAIHNIRFDYSMLETCESILNAQEVL